MRKWIVFLMIILLMVMLFYVKECRDDARRRAAVYCQTTQKAVADLRGWLVWRSRGNGSLPPSGIDNVVELMKTDEFLATWKDCGLRDPYVRERGVDAWGNRMIFERFDDKHGVIRSIGPNGIDEHGKGDDIQLEIPGELGSEQ